MHTYIRTQWQAGMHTHRPSEKRVTCPLRPDMCGDLELSLRVEKDHMDIFEIENVSDEISPISRQKIYDDLFGFDIMQ